MSEITVRSAAAKIASMKHPSIPQLLKKRGFGYEADRVQELMDAAEREAKPKKDKKATPVISDIVITYYGEDEPKIDCSPEDLARIKLVDGEEAALLYMEHNGVKIYHTLNQGCVSENWYATVRSLDKDQDSDDMFDIRELDDVPAKDHKRLSEVFKDDGKITIAYAIEQGKICLDALV